MSREGGYSLIELLIVMAIIAILSLAAAPWFMKISQRNQIKSASQELAITLAAARGRAVRRNLPARVVMTPLDVTNQTNLVETFEETQPTPLKVSETRISAQIIIPPDAALGAPYPNQPCPPATTCPPYVVVFGPDGRVTSMATVTTNEATFTLRGIRGNSVQNDLPVQVSRNGKIEVLGPNPTVAKKRGTGWH